jgi:hypothetical protein
MAALITRAQLAQVGTDVDALFRAALSDGSATVLVADRKVDATQADVRVRADKAITVRRAANSLAHRWGGDWTREAVLAHYGVEDSREIARGGLREAYLREQGVVRVG